MSAAVSKPIGGEPHVDFRGNVHSYVTDSGRSSLRLILRSGFRSRRFLLPDFLCGVISRVLDEEKVAYEYYRVNPDFSIDARSVGGRDFDALYVIDYFGQRADHRGLLRDGAWLVEDAVFLPFVEKPPEVENWICYNSLRKISSLADGSFVTATTRLSRELIVQQEAEFSRFKYRAQRIKQEYLIHGRHREQDYLDLFQQAEALADGQKDIYRISDESLAHLPGVYRNLDAEYASRRANYAALDQYLHHRAIPMQPEYPCLYVLSVERRDELREHLRSGRIYLPRHWPNERNLANSLYASVISIPVDSRYDTEDMRRVAQAINGFYA